MNALTPFALVAEQPSTLLSRLDVSDIEVVKDARHDLRRCRTEKDFADWAATWGEQLCNRAEDMSGMNEGDDTALDEAEAEAAHAKKRLADLRAVVERAVRDLDAAGDGPADKFPGAVEAVTSRLENAL